MAKVIYFSMKTVGFTSNGYRLLSISAIAILAFFITFCNQEKITPNLPVIVTGEVTDIGPDGATFHGSIINRGKGSVTEVGFVWDTVDSPGLNSSRKVITCEDGTTAFHAQIAADHQAGKEYSVMAYLKNGEQTIFGNSVKFTSIGSQPPEIIDFSPKSGLKNTEVLIYGKNFSYVPSHIKVMFGNVPGIVMATTDSTITVRIPTYVYSSKIVKITVSVLDKSTVSDESFELDGVFIESFFPKSTGCGGVVKIKGKNFKMGQWTNVYFRHKYDRWEYQNAEIIALTDTTISVKVPVKKNGDQDLYLIEVHTDGYVGIANEEFSVINPLISSVSKSIIMPYDTLVIRGENFGDISYVIIGEYWYSLFVQKEDEVSIIISPDLPSGYYELRILNECFKTGIYSEKILIESPWQKVSNLPLKPRVNAICLALGDNIYIGLGADNCASGREVLTDFWEYNTLMDHWTRKADFPGNPTEFQDYCLHDGKIIIGPGHPPNAPIDPALFWQYDPSTDSWEEHSSFLNSARFGGLLYSIQNQLYYGLPYNENGLIANVDFYYYSQEDDKWNFYQTFPFSFSTEKLLSFSINDFGVFVDGGTHSWPPVGIFTLNPRIGWRHIVYLDDNLINIFNNDDEVVFVHPYSDYYVRDLSLVDISTWQIKKILPSINSFGLRKDFIGAITSDRLYIGLGEGPDGCYNDMIYLDLNDYR
jgi:hypothetical protein